MLAEVGHLAGVLGASMAGYMALPLKRDTPPSAAKASSVAIAGAALVSAILISLGLPDWPTGFGLWMAGLMVGPPIVVLAGPRLRADTLRRSAMGATAISAAAGLYGVIG